MLLQSSAKVKTGSLWNKRKDDLKKQLVELKTELGQLRTQKIAGGASSKLTKMLHLAIPPPPIPLKLADPKKLTGFCFSSHDLRKSIARVLTVINHKQRSQLRLFYAKKKYIPLDLRPKQTRAIRRRLTKHEATRVTEKQKKRQIHFPQRKYAVMA